jgi:TonB-dependent receptor
MKRQSGFSWLATGVALAFALNPVWAAAESPTGGSAPATTAAVSGRVQNAAIGRYLAGAQVIVRGTGLATSTDEFGTYRLNQVPVGPLVLEVRYTGLDPQHIAVTATAGQTVVQDVNLTNAARYGAGSDAVRLGEFVVSTSRVSEGEELATNEQRYAPNIKNVVATDTFGDVQEGNVGEFIKFLPGVAVNYGDAEAQTVSLRGLPDNLSNITVDGAEVANANFSGGTRAPKFGATSIGTVSRVEIVKVPLPSTPADSLGGSINMVSKSAFERTRQEFRYRGYLTGNSLRLKLRSPNTAGDRVLRNVLPSFDFDYTQPIGRNLGIVVTGLSTGFYNEQHLHQTAWLGSAANTNASPANPIRTSDVMIDAPRFTWRDALGLNAAWRPGSNAVLSASFSQSKTRAQTANVNRSALPGSNPTPTVPVGGGGVALSWGPDFTIGATGRGSVTLSGNSISRVERTRVGRVQSRFDHGDWRLNATASRSTSAATVRGAGPGWVFTSINATLARPVRVSLLNISPLGDGDSTTVARAFWNDNAPVDLNDLENYTGTTATRQMRDITDDVGFGQLDLRKRLAFFSFPAALQIGGAWREREHDERWQSLGYTFQGVDGRLAATPLGYRVYVGQDHGFGIHGTQFINVGAASRLYKEDSRTFAPTLAQQAAAATYAITNSEFIRERNAAFYLQAEAKLFRNRLEVITGVRYEGTESRGLGPVYDPAAVFLRNPDGTFARNAQGRQNRKPEAGAAGSLEEVALTRTERGNRAGGEYDGLFPSMHLTFQVAPDFLVRLAYAQTYGRPNFDSIIPNVSISERDLTEEQLHDPNVIPGTITIRNTNLKPWDAANYDLSLEYYTKGGGVFTAGAFLKEIKGFFVSDVRIATEADAAQFGLDSRYAGFTLSTTRNGGDARVTGAEISARHSLAPLGRWGRGLEVFVNATKVRPEGEQATNFSGFIPETVNWGVTYSRRPLLVMAKWNWRSEVRGAPLPATYGPDAYSYTDDRIQLDLNLEYQVYKRLSLFLYARNLFDARNVLLRKGSQTAGYAAIYQSADYGAQLSAGIKGSF